MASQEGPACIMAGNARNGQAAMNGAERSPVPEGTGVRLVKTSAGATNDLHSSQHANAMPRPGNENARCRWRARRCLPVLGYP